MYRQCTKLILSITAVILSVVSVPVHGRTFETYTATVSQDDSVTRERLIAVVNNTAATTAQRIGALDSLSLYADPGLFQLFKDVAFRSSDRELAVHAVTLLGSFAATYRLPEMCDTLTDVIRYSGDGDIRFAALMCLKDIATILPCDRNAIIGALLYVVAPDTYSRDARLFFNAVPFFVAMAAHTDAAVLSMLDYLKAHYEEYTFDNMIEATDAYKTFTNSIAKTYRDQVESQTVPEQISEMFTGAVTKDYITVIAFMLDSVATDTLGFSAISWLLQNGDNENGDEAERLSYMALQAPIKRPDKAVEILAAMQPLLQKYGVRVRTPRVAAADLNRRIQALINTFDGTVSIKNGEPQSKVTVFSIDGRKLCEGYGSRIDLIRQSGKTAAVMHYIVTVDGTAVPCSIIR